MSSNVNWGAFCTNGRSQAQLIQFLTGKINTGELERQVRNDLKPEARRIRNIGINNARRIGQRALASRGVSYS